MSFLPYTLTKGVNYNVLYDNQFMFTGVFRGYDYSGDRACLLREGWSSLTYIPNIPEWTLVDATETPIEEEEVQPF
ncbi:hypothetical protein A4L_30 [Anabaena phage A-4L]|uniref:Uncharacterized protein n=1 Tax=Anabaena phage A-4L TaxID=1357732 RepID=A0A059PYA8_9CAUD|nr:hypothetical protein A4L_30 [Anabaena phage A-4L]AGR48557.1 hypothetical protein A4L_30 [Anabaena phage A-4L]